MIFIEIQNLHQLEKEHRWEEAISLLKNKWYENKDNFDVMLRLATECWYILSNWDFLDLDKSDLEFENVQFLLIETYNHFRKYCKDYNKGLAIFGYMISLFPNYFYMDKDCDERMFLIYEKIGKDMLKLAYINEQSNKLYKTLYMGSENSKKYEKAKRDIRVNLKELFPKNSEVEQYFKEVLSSEL